MGYSGLDSLFDRLRTLRAEVRRVEDRIESEFDPFPWERRVVCRGLPMNQSGPPAPVGTIDSLGRVTLDRNHEYLRGQALHQNQRWQMRRHDG